MTIFSGNRMLCGAVAIVFSLFIPAQPAGAWQADPAESQAPGNAENHGHGDDHDHAHDHAHGHDHGHDHGHSHDHAHDHHAHGDGDAAAPGEDEASPAAAAPPVPIPAIQLSIYCLLIVGASLLGGLLPSLIHLTHDRMQMLMSLAGGLMLGIGMYHMLPHAVHELGSLDRGIWWMMIGLVSMFLLIRMFHFHQHEPLALEDGPTTGLTDPVSADEGTPPTSNPVDHHQHSHGHSHAGCNHEHAAAHQLSWVGVFIGLSLHTLIDGVALAASVQADAQHGGSGWLPGFGTFLAVMLHKPLDAVSITSLMAAGGWKPASRNLANLAYSCMCPLGAAVFAAGVWQMQGSEHLVIGCALAFAAGVFVCISLGDLLPEMEFHSHNRILLTVLLLTGVALAWAIGFLEPAHTHSH